MTDWHARQLFAERRRLRRNQRAREITMYVNKLSADRAEIEQEYKRVSEVYIRHLERLKAKMDKNLIAIKSCQTSAEQLVA